RFPRREDRATRRRPLSTCLLQSGTAGALRRGRATPPGPRLFRRGCFGISSLADEQAPFRGPVAPERGRARRGRAPVSREEFTRRAQKLQERVGRAKADWRRSKKNSRRARQANPNGLESAKRSGRTA